ncbi:MAG: hypothetical protein JKX73_10910 [Flavobacteriales bacterium]|nr:hypothetical protein [Flavobacteriales bacterium]
MKKILLPCLCAVFLIVSACTKPGTGGKATLSVHIFEDDCDVPAGGKSKNHTVVPEAIIYIKYGGTAVDIDVTSYDDFQSADFGGKTVFEGLRRGDYYLYGVSKDGTETGGTHFEIKNRIGEREVVISTGRYE